MTSTWQQLYLGACHPEKDMLKTGNLKRVSSTSCMLSTLGWVETWFPRVSNFSSTWGMGCEDGETDDVFLKRVTMEMRATCKLFGTLSSNLFSPQAFGTFFYRTGGILCFCQQYVFFTCAVQIPRLYLPRRVLTESNCSGYGNDDYAELGSKFKAQHVKCMVWFLARKLEELSADSVSG